MNEAKKPSAILTRRSLLILRGGWDFKKTQGPFYCDCFAMLSRIYWSNKFDIHTVKSYQFYFSFRRISMWKTAKYLQTYMNWQIGSYHRIWFLRMLSMNLPVKLLRMDYCNATVHVVYTVCYTINCICQCIVLYFKTYFHFRKGNSKPRVIFIGCWWVI